MSMDLCAAFCVNKFLGIPVVIVAADACPFVAELVCKNFGSGDTFRLLQQI
jgi:hypothetical protein